MRKIITISTLLLLNISSANAVTHVNVNNEEAENSGGKNSSSATLNAIQSKYDKVLVSFIDKEKPGVAAIVSKNGSILYKGARGMANLEHNVPLKTDSIFRLGSITKQFTAAAIVMLQEQGKLKVTDNIHKYIPDFPTENQVVTIEHLLTHTSGIANYTEDENIWKNLLSAPTTLDEMIALFATHPMPLKTGEAMRYSNTGYVLLGKIIEVVSGQTYPEFIEQQIFTKLGMKNSSYGGQQIIHNRANGYTQTEHGFVNADPINMMWPHAAGSLLSTVDDLNIWYKALRDGTLITKASYQKMIAPFTLNNKSTSNYGYGLGNFKVNSYQAIGHGGGIHGFVTNAFYLPEEDLYVAVLYNNDTGNPRDIALMLTARALNLEIPEFTEITLSEKTIKPLMGTYMVDENSQRTLTFEKGKIYAQRDDGHKWQIKAMSENSFYYEGSLSYFSIDKNKQGKQVMNFYSDLATEPQSAIKK